MGAPEPVNGEGGNVGHDGGHVVLVRSHAPRRGDDHCVALRLDLPIPHVPRIYTN